MHIYTLKEVSLMAERLMEGGMSLAHAVNHVAYAYGFSIDDVYKYMTDHNVAHQGKSSVPNVPRSTM